MGMSSHVFEPAASGRAKCRGCGERIVKGELRFGERLPNPYADGDDAEMTHWFHVACAAFKRPEPFLEGLSASSDAIDDRDRLTREAELGIAHRRLPRVSTAGRAPSGRARCRSCRKMIEKDAWRISLVFYEDGRFAPSGFIHVTCAPAYLETTDCLDRLQHFSPELGDGDIEEIRAELEGH
jgi:hypothetical protein